jgi:hypothetical protein
VTKNLLKSGETAELVAKFNTDRFEGQHGATLTVRFAHPFSAEVRLRVDGYVRRDVVIHPGRIEFGSVDSAQGVEKRVKVYYAGRSTWQLTEVRTTNEDFEVDLKLARRSGGRAEYDLTFRLRPGARSGYINDQLTLVTNDLTRKYIPLAVEGRVISSLAVSPSSLQLGVVRLGETVTKQIVVRGTAPFTIRNVRCASGDGCFSFQSGARPRELHLIPVTYTAEKGAGKFVDRILIEVDGHDQTAQVTAHVEVVED